MLLVNKIENFFRYIGDLSIFVKDVLVWTLYGKRKLKDLVRDIIFIGIDSFGLVTLISFFIGIIIAFQTAYQLKTFSSEIYLAPLVALSLTRELGPVIGSLIVAARSGASITAQIGAMKISEQIDALDVMGVEPINYLVAPKFISLILSMPLLVIYADFFGILGGYLVGYFKFDIRFGFYFQMTFSALKYKDILSGLLKSICFGSIIAFISCFEGLRPLSSSDVAKSVTNSVVRSFIMIIIFDCILTAFFYFIFV
ncbi:MAG: ABC transporter permease [Candidatus Omnitrophica bacterium]|nr:ABC transporter permease [Candidatus Omnitrophota bacterium]MCM8826038.1 ABC transporter permease [Candidatus Omnitrophota bacterium]